MKACNYPTTKSLILLGYQSIFIGTGLLCYTFTQPCSVARYTILSSSSRKKDGKRKDTRSNHIKMTIKGKERKREGMEKKSVRNKKVCNYASSYKIQRCNYRLLPVFFMCATQYLLNRFFFYYFVIICNQVRIRTAFCLF